jgi:hypothetical protein
MIMSFNSQELEGKWVILLDGQVVESGDDIRSLVERARASCPGKKFVLAKVPTKDSMIY